MEMDVDFIKKVHGFKCRRCEKPFHASVRFGKDWTIAGFVLVCECGPRSKVLPSYEAVYNKLVSDVSIKKDRVE